MKNKLKLLTLCTCLACGSTYANAGAVQNQSTKTENDEFVNNGLMQAKQKVVGGVGIQTVALRAVKPTLVQNFTLTSKNNTYINNGKMIADQKVLGGAATQTVALDSH